MQDRVATLGRLTLRYRDTGGDGPVVLLLHGIAGSLDHWNRQIEAPGGLRLIALDLPGHGLSDLAAQTMEPDSFAPLVVAFAEAMGLERYALVGNSMGGAIALRVAGLVPDRVTHVVAMNAAMLGRATYLPFRLMTLPGLGEVMTKPSKASVARMIAGVFHNPAQSVTADLRAAFDRDQFKPGGAGAFLATLRRMTDLGGQRREGVVRSHHLIRQMRVPLLFVHGRNDRVIPVQQAIDAAALHPAARIEVLEDCGHMAMIEQPARLNALMAGFILP